MGGNLGPQGSIDFASSLKRNRVYCAELLTVPLRDPIGVAWKYCPGDVPKATLKTATKALGPEEPREKEMMHARCKRPSDNQALFGLGYRRWRRSRLDWNSPLGPSLSIG